MESSGRTIYESRAEETRRAERGRFARFAAFCDAYAIDMMPAQPAAVAAYIEFMDREGKALATIEAYVSAIATAHSDRGLANPCANQGVRLALAGKRRQRAGERQRQARALSEGEMQSVVMSLGWPRAARGRGGGPEKRETAARRAANDLALLLAMTQGGLRRSEAERLSWGDVSLAGDGSGRIYVGRSKTDQEGKGAVVAVRADCAAALMRIRPAEAADADRVFGVSGRQIDRRLKAMCAAAGIGAEGISGHTPRVTLARRMSERGAPSHVIQRQGRWASAGMVLLYTRNAQAAEALQWL